ncbi:MAG: CpaF family protein [Pseudomonadota bacterium]
MRLSQRLGTSRAQPETRQTVQGVAAPAASPAPAPPASSSDDLVSIIARLHPKILDRLDLAAVSQLSPEELRPRLRSIVEQVVNAERVAVSENERDQVVDSILDELIGLGPLETLLKDPSVSDILVNGSSRVYVERGGKLQLSDIRFRDDKHLFHTIQRMVAKVGRRIDESSPMVDARLPDGSRVNAVVPPLAIDGPSLSIRRFGSRPLSGTDLVEHGALSREMLKYLQIAVQAKCTILIAGGTGAGKTTMLNALSSFIPLGERIITVEDAAELQLAQPHVVRLESRPPQLEGKGEVSIRDLVKNALRMRPDRIVVGEVRGAEVLDMLQAMNTGHDGSLATIHANSAEDAVSRLMTMLGMSGTKFSEETMATLIGRAIHIILHVSRMQDGKRKVTAIAEIAGLSGKEITLSPLYVYERAGMTSDGTVIGRHVLKGRTALGSKFKAIGIQGGTVAGEIA